MKILLQLLLAITGLFVIISFSQCKKDKTFTIRGRVVDSCFNWKPIKGVEVSIEQNQLYSISTGGCKSGINSSAITNENGEFFLQYDHVCFDHPIKLQIINFKGPTQVSSVSLIPVNQSLNAGDIVFKNNVILALDIITDTAYSVKDTLFYNIIDTGFTGNDSTFQFITGPFTNGQRIDKVITTASYIYGDNGGQFYFRWILKNGSKLYKPVFIGVRAIAHEFKADICNPNAKINLNISR